MIPISTKPISTAILVSGRHIFQKKVSTVSSTGWLLRSGKLSRETSFAGRLGLRMGGVTPMAIEVGKVKLSTSKDG